MRLSDGVEWNGFEISSRLTLRLVLKKRLAIGKQKPEFNFCGAVWSRAQILCQRFWRRLSDKVMSPCRNTSNGFTAFRKNRMRFDADLREIRWITSGEKVGEKNEVSRLKWQKQHLKIWNLN